MRTMEPAVPVVRELAVAGDRIAAAGDGLRRIDLEGCCVVPGLTDSHVHFPTWAMAQRQVRFEDCRSLEDAVERVRAAAASARPGAWLTGFGWRSADWDPVREPTRHDLDAVTGDLPVALQSKDYHSLWLNSAALARANGDLRREGGVVETDEHGEPTGLLREEAAWAFRDRHVRFSEDEYVDATLDGIRIANARGVTAVHDKDGGIGAPEIWQRVRERDALTLRVWQSVLHHQAAEYATSPLRRGDAFLRLGYLKAFMDGSLGSGTALMLDGTGVEITSSDELARIVVDGARAGWPVAVHAIGDAANRAALDAFEATAAEWRTRGLRPRIEHAQHVHPDDLPRFGALGVACSVQFSHAPSDRDMAERLVPGRLDGTYAFRSLWDAGALVANGSDAPIEELDPLLGIRAGVLRSFDDRPAWRPQEALSVEQALQASTVNPAWLCGDEGERGQLVPGQLADLVVLDRDPVTCTAEELGGVQVVATMVGGRWVHGPYG